MREVIKGQLVDRRLREMRVNRLELIRPVEELRQIFRCRLALHDWKPGYAMPHECSTLDADVVRSYKLAYTFEDFLKINRLPVYERELR